MKEADVRNIPLKFIQPNTDNPRLIFDQEKLDELIFSIKERGVLVPLSVYVDNSNKKFTIIDGERRYRAALKLGLENLPAIVGNRPHEQEYVMDMFHIHHMRENWQLVPTAIELKKVSEILEERNKKNPTEKELSSI